MRNEIFVEKVIVNKNRVDYKYRVNGVWKNSFKLENDFFIEYSDSIEGVPKSITIIPLICNILPIAWVYDAEIIIDEIDEDFYKSIQDFKNGYKNMFPMIEFKGNIKAGKVVKNNLMSRDESIVLYSGGVDATSTLFTHINEQPILMTLWGSDVFFDDIEGWHNVKQQVEKTSNTFNLKKCFVKSSFRYFLDTRILDEKVLVSGDTWWHGFQHGIGLIGHAAPYAYKKNVCKIYIASSYTINDKVTCASDPTIDNYLRFFGCDVIHDGYEFSRQEKIGNICTSEHISEKDIFLRVCWKSKGGKNCCTCEKCFRTIYGILAENQDPHKFGFYYTNDQFKNIEYEIKNKLFMEDILKPLWNDIKIRFMENRDSITEETIWITKFNFNRINATLPKLIYRTKNKIKRTFSR